MQRATIVLVVLSVLVAAVLWMSATLLQHNIQGEQDGADDSFLRQPRPAQQEPAEAPPMSCEETENRLTEVVEGSRSCVADEECTLFDYGYPIDCMTAVAKDRIPRLREEYRKYDESCEYRVFFDCPTEPFVRLPVCRNNRCVVELDRSEPPGGPGALRGLRGD